MFINIPPKKPDFVECILCFGTGKCPSCEGTGKWKAFFGQWGPRIEKCKRCTDHPGICPLCKGTGDYVR